MARDIVRRNGTHPAAASSGLPVDQERAISALLTGESVTAAAGRAGVSRQTVHRWLAEDPAFIAEYNQARREIAEAVVGAVLPSHRGEAPAPPPRPRTGSADPWG